jgi:hypothetical protein
MRVPLGRHLHRDALVQQRMCGRIAVPPQTPHLPFPRQQPVCCACRDALEFAGDRLAAMHFPALPQAPQFGADRRHQALPARVIEQLPELHQHRQDFRTVGGAAGTPPARLSHFRRMRQLADQNLPVQPGSFPRFVQ